MSPSRAPIGRVEWTRWVAAMACRCGRSTHGDNDAPRSDVQGFCANPPENKGATGASPFIKIWSKFVHELKILGCENHDISNLYLQPAVAQLITKGLKVEVKGNEEGADFKWSEAAVKQGSPLCSHAARIVAVKDGGKYEVEFDNVTSGKFGTKGYKPHIRRTLRATQFRIL